MSFDISLQVKQRPNMPSESPNMRNPGLSIKYTMQIQHLAPRTEVASTYNFFIRTISINLMTENLTKIYQVVNSFIH